jgi:triphosphoribosyl-dephospho-CoA synthetase
LVSASEIYRSASVMIRKYGENAALEAGIRADRLLDQGDIEGQCTWLRILNAIKELQNTTPSEGDIVH